MRLKIKRKDIEGMQIKFFELTNALKRIATKVTVLKHHWPSISNLSMKITMGRLSMTDILKRSTVRIKKNQFNEADKIFILFTLYFLIYL